MKVEISLFRFDYQMDYLPYYTKHFIKIKKEETLLDLLNTINAQENFAYEKNNDFLLCVNGLFTCVNVNLKELLISLGKDLTIDPLSSVRVSKDLLIDTKDFKEKLSYLENYIFTDILPTYMRKEFHKIYEGFKIYFYASLSLSLHRDYLGDAFILLCEELIKKYPKEEKKLLTLLLSIPKGLSYHTSLCPRIYKFDVSIEKKITDLQDKAGVLSAFDTKSIENKNKIVFDEKENKQDIKHDFKDFNIYYYHGNEKKESTLLLLNTLQAKQINVSSMSYDLALGTYKTNANFSHELASKILIDAFDNAADFVLVDKKEYFYLFDNNMKIFEKIAQREINIPILYISELELLAKGEHLRAKQSLEKHCIDLEII